MVERATTPTKQAPTRVVFASFRVCIRSLTAPLPRHSPLALVSLVYSPYTKIPPVQEPHDFPRQSGAHCRRLDVNVETTSSKCIAPGANPLPAGKGRRDEELAVSFISLVGLL